MKKVLALVLALAMVLSVVACSGSTTSTATTTETTTTETAAATTDAAAATTEAAATETTMADREHVTITFSQYGNSLDDVDGYNNDPIRQAIEDKLNITLEYDTGSDGFNERMETMLYAGNADDLLCSYDSTAPARYAEEELVWDLAEIVNADPERYPVLYKMFNDENYKAYNQNYFGDPDKAYAIFSIAAFDYPQFGGMSVYNQAILDEVNSGAVPKTVEEFEAYAAAAGAAGYIGWWPRNDKLTNWYEINAQIALPQGTSIMAPSAAGTGTLLSGELGTDSEYWTVSATSEASKAVIEQLHEMYVSGGLSANIGIGDDFTDAYADFGTGKIGAANYGFGYPTQYRDFYNDCWVAAKGDAAQTSDLTFGYSLTSNGNYGTIYQSPLWVGWFYFIPKTCTYPERVLDLVEFIASNEGQDLIFNTVDGVYNEAQGLEYWDAINTAYGYDNRCKYTWFTYVFSALEYRADIENSGWWTAVCNPVDYSANWDSDINKELIQTAQNTVSEYRDAVNVLLPSYYGFVTLSDEANEIATKLADITNQYLSAMIVGSMDIETGWAEYQAAYEAAGAAQFEQLLNEAVATARTTYGDK